MLLASGSAAASAQDVRVQPVNCAAGVHLTARDARLSDVLGSMARALGFQLRFEADVDPIVSFDATGQPGELVTRAAGSMNLSTIQARNPRCPRRMRLLKVWVLPGGNATAAAAPPLPQQPAPPTPMQEFESQQGVDQYMRAHGMPATQSEY